MLTYRDLSKLDASPANEKEVGTHDIVVGCLQRLADGVEATGKNVKRLEDELYNWKRLAEARRLNNQMLLRRIAGLKGYVKRLKAKEK